MILYEYRCENCSENHELYVPIEQRHNQYCPVCGMKMRKLLSNAKPHIFKPYWDDMMDTQPIYIESAEQKKQELEKRGLQMRA